jgi:hypothetical protein
MRRATHHLADLAVGLDGGQDGRPVAVVEELVLELDLADVGLPGDDPERIEAFGLGDVERRLGAQTGEGFVDRSTRSIGFGVNDGGGDIGGRRSGSADRATALARAK